MSRRPAHFTQADIARAIRAVQQTGAPFVAVELKPDGTVIVTQAREPPQAQDTVAEQHRVLL
jgi:tRNA(Arg) A34 adenosine deaminase TadA